jgi:hypothetical protein
MEQEQEREVVEQMAEEAAMVREEMMEPLEDMQDLILCLCFHLEEQPTMDQEPHQEAQDRPIMTQA